MAGPTPSASGHAAYHIHVAQSPGGQPDYRPGAASGETPFSLTTEGHVCTFCVQPPNSDCL